MGPDQTEYAITLAFFEDTYLGLPSPPINLLNSSFGIKSGVEVFFGHVLQYMYNGDYSIPVPTHNSASVTYEDEINAVYLRLREKYLQNHMSIEQSLGKHAGIFSRDLRSPVFKRQNYLCGCPDVLLTHARLRVFTKSHSLDMLSRLTL